jgi:hypothetical protein
MDDLDLFNATKYSFKNREDLLRSDRCGCYYCQNVFPPSTIEEWVDSGLTGLCPHCGIDAVIGSNTGFPIHKEILATLNRLFFQTTHFILYRPVGPKELSLIEESGWSRFPPRLPDQPIFYPTLNQKYASQIARNWNVKQSGSGYVTKFLLNRDYAKKFKVKTVGSVIHQELWVPAEELDEFNENIIGKIELVESYSESDNPK